MFRRILLVAALSTSVAVFGQGNSGGTGGTSSPATAPAATSAPGVPTTQGAVGGLSGQEATGPMTVPSANQAGVPTVPDTVGGVEGNNGTTQGNPANLNNGTLTNGGFIGASVAGSPLATPNATFASPQPTAGISQMGRAGISTDTPLQTGLQSTVTPSTIVYTNIEPVNPPAANMNPQASGRMINDAGPSYFAGGGSLPASMMAVMSLGEVAAKFKSQKPTQNVRTYTNADVERINSSMNLRGTNINANFTPSSAQTAAPQSASATPPTQAPATQPAVSIPQSGPPSPFEPRLSASARPSPAIRAEGAQSSAAQSSASAQSEAGNTAQPGSENATTPQVNQPQSGRNGGQESGRSLPATSTLLPLLGILGLASGGIGFFFRKFRR